MRRIRVIKPVSTTRVTSPTRTFGPTQTDLGLYLSQKFRIDKQDAMEIVRTVFAYIRCEVLLYGAQFSITNFGTFRRRFENYVRNPKLFGEGTERAYMRFVNPANGGKNGHGSRVVDPDEESVPPNEDEQHLYADLEDGDLE